MLGPFPGMDPYLEEASDWPDLHSRLITAISDALAAAVAPAFIVRIEQRVYITSAEESGRQPIVPDLYLVHGPQEAPALAPASGISTPTLIEPIFDLEIRDRYIEIHDARSREVVATIEVLSPFNKAVGTIGHEQFQRKRRAVLASPVHWIEIDLLRGGERPPEVAGRSDYYALLNRGGSIGPFAVWYADVRDPLPTIAVPLRSPHQDVPLDLQRVLNGIYERAFYAESVDYTRRMPGPPLRPADELWAAEQVRRWQSSRVQR
jgi:hypothetical protein